MFKRYILAGFFVAVAVSTLFLSSRTEAQKNTAPSAAGTKVTAQVIQLAGFAETAAVRTLPNAGTTGQPDPELRGKGGHEINELNTEEVRPNVPGNFPDGSVQRQLKAASKPALSDIWTKAVPSATNGASPATATQLFTFEGIPVQASAPPDTNADVGPNDIVETVNTLVRVYDRNGNPRGPAFKQSSLYSKIGGVCATTDDGDPIVLYDRLADRWLISQFGFTGQTTPPYHECVAISKTGDPTGEYYVYDFVLPGTEFPDYPHFGVWSNGYYWTTNQFNMGGPFDGGGVFAVDRAKMLVGDPTAGGVYFNLNLATHPEGIFGMLPTDHDGINPPPAGVPELFVYFTNTAFGDPADGLRLFDLNFDTAVYANSTFVERSESTYASPLALAPFDARDPNGRGDIEQPPPAGNNSTDRLDSIGSRLMWRLQYINRNGTESVVGNFTVNTSGLDASTAANYQAGFRYFELRRGCPGCSYSVNEDATFVPPGGGGGPTGDNAWIGSAAMDNFGNIAIQYSISGVSAGPPAHNPSAAYAARNFFDAPNGLSEAALLFYGTGVQRGTTNRWGDYSSLMLDPVDDCTFWWANEYYTSNNLTFNWQTRLGAFVMPVCSAPAQGTLSGLITACDSGAPISLAMVQVSNGTSTTTVGDGTYSIQLPPGDYTVTIVDPNRKCNAAGSFPVTITDGNTTTLNTCLNGKANIVVDPTDPTLFAVSGGNGNGIIDANECNMLTVIGKNFGCAVARNVVATLSTSTAGVTVTQPTSAVVDLGIDASAANTTPFKVSTAPGFVCGTPINFTITYTFTGGSTSNNFTLASCTETQAPVSFSGTLQPGDSVQTGRNGRDGNPSVCPGKACPGALTATPHLYDQLTFVNGPNSACVTISTQTTANPGTNPILTKAYLGSYDPTNFCTNYLGDSGLVGATNYSFQVTIPANATLVVVVEESGNGGFATPTPYTGSVSGLAATTPTPGSGICKTTPVMTTQASPNTHAAGGGIFDTATISGLSGAAGGTIQFRLYGPNQANCGGAVVFSSTVTVNGNGSYTSDTYFPPAGKEGVYRWVATYSGDATNDSVSGACNDAHESVTVLAAGTSVMGEGTIDAGGCTASFDLNAFPSKHGKTGGSADYFDPCAGIALTQVKLTGLTISGDEAIITGVGKLGKKTKVSFVMFVFDNGAPNPDEFFIQLSNGYSAGGDLESGSITIK